MNKDFGAALQIELDQRASDSLAKAKAHMEAVMKARAETGLKTMKGAQKRLATDELKAAKARIAELEKALAKKSNPVPQADAVKGDVGRPLAATDAQCAEVRKLRKAEVSLRDIAERTGLGVRTVRTILSGQ